MCVVSHNLTEWWDTRGIVQETPTYCSHHSESQTLSPVRFQGVQAANLPGLVERYPCYRAGWVLIAIGSH